MSDSIVGIERDVERSRSVSQFVAALRALANSLERGEPFVIQVGGERLRVPVDANLSVEHERDEDEQELEFQLKWPSSAHK